MPVVALPFERRLDVIGGVEQERERHLEDAATSASLGVNTRSGGMTPITGVTWNPVTVR